MEIQKLSVIDRFVISRSAVQFRPLAPYKTMGCRITSVAHFDYVGTM